MNCSEAQTHLLHYALDEAANAQPDRAELEEHLHQCADCQALVQDLRSTSELLRQAFRDTPQPRLSPARRSALAQLQDRASAVRRPAPVLPFNSWRRFIQIAASIAIVGGLAIWIQWRPQPTQGRPSSPASPTTSAERELTITWWGQAAPSPQLQLQPRPSDSWDAPVGEPSPAHRQPPLRAAAPAPAEPASELMPALPHIPLNGMHEVDAWLASRRLRLAPTVPGIVITPPVANGEDSAQILARYGVSSDRTGSELLLDYRRPAAASSPLEPGQYAATGAAQAAAAPPVGSSAAWQQLSYFLETQQPPPTPVISAALQDYVQTLCRATSTTDSVQLNCGWAGSPVRARLATLLIQIGAPAEHPIDNAVLQIHVPHAIGSDAIAAAAGGKAVAAEATLTLELGHIAAAEQKLLLFDLQFDPGKSVIAKDIEVTLDWLDKQYHRHDFRLDQQAELAGAACEIIHALREDGLQQRRRLVVLERRLQQLASLHQPPAQQLMELLQRRHRAATSVRR